MRFFKRWLFRESKNSDLGMSSGNSSTHEPSSNDRSLPSPITQEPIQIKDPFSAEEAIVQVPEAAPHPNQSPEVIAIPTEQRSDLAQSMIDAELVNSAAWSNDIEKSNAEWGRILDLIQEKVSVLQREGNTALLMALSAYFDLSIHSPQNVLGESFNAQLKKKIEDLFDLQEFRKFIEEKSRTRWTTYPRSVDYYMGEFVMHRPRYLQGINHFVELIADNLTIVEHHIDELLKAEREHNPKAGGLKLSAWIGFMRNFAKLHLIGIELSDFFPETAPRHLRDYRASEMSDASTRFLWALMGVLQVFARPIGPSTSEVGVEFEKKLIAEISATYPNAQINPTPKTGDQGADVIMLINGIKIVIQAKKYTGVVGNAAVQEVFTAKEYYEADYAMVVTSSRYTQSACSLAAKIGVELATAQDYLRKVRQLLV